MMRAITLVATLLLSGCCSVAALVPESNRTSEAPYHSSIAIVPEEARDKFLDAVRRAAEEQAFAVRVAPTHPDQQHFLVQLWRSDIKGIFTNSVNSSEVRMSFFVNTAHQLPQAALDAAPAAFESAAESVSGVKVLVGSQ